MKLINYLTKETNLIKGFEESIKLMHSINLLKGNILDVGAGVAWTSAILSKYEKVQKVKSLDCSEHRLMTIAPIVFNQFEGNLSKFDPVVADFTDIVLKKESYNVVLFCQSLYMFPNMEDILKKAYSLLVPGGVLLVIAESIAEKSSDLSLGYRIRCLKQKITGRADISNNHFYRDEEYKNAIQRVGFQYVAHEMDFPVFHSVNRNCLNHIGIKCMEG